VAWRRHCYWDVSCRAPSNCTCDFSPSRRPDCVSSTCRQTPSWQLSSRQFYHDCNITPIMEAIRCRFKGRAATSRTSQLDAGPGPSGPRGLIGSPLSSHGRNGFPQLSGMAMALLHEVVAPPHDTSVNHFVDPDKRCVPEGNATPFTTSAPLRYPRHRDESRNVIERFSDDDEAVRSRRSMMMGFISTASSGPQRHLHTGSPPAHRQRAMLLIC
jgi:hypothetical protein